MPEWLARHVPDMLESTIDDQGSLIDQARTRLLGQQDTDILNGTKAAGEAAGVRKLISGFLADCSREGLDPTVDIGQLRRDRWRQWKRIPAEYRQNPPLKTFRITPGYIFAVNIAKYKDEFCLSLDGTLYKHQLNAVDPYPLEELLKIATVEKIAEGLIGSLVWLLQAKQHPVHNSIASAPAAVKAVPDEPVAGQDEQPAERAPKLGGFRLPFGSKSRADETAPQDGQDKTETGRSDNAESSEPAAVIHSGPVAGITSTGTE